MTGRDDRSVWQYLNTHVPHFHVARGMRPGGCFYQDAAWSVRCMVIDSVARHADAVRTGCRR